MRVNPIYKSLVEKSVSSMISAIELYNKPDFKYREETFSILAVNAWELLLKAYILKKSRYKMQEIFVLKPKVLKNGKPSNKTKIPKLNRSGSPMTISILEAIKKVEGMGVMPPNVKENIELLVELRDASIHFVNDGSLSKQIQELGFACIKNYMNIVRDWGVDVNLDQYNLYLMPLAYISNREIIDPVDLTDGEEKFIEYAKSVLSNKANTDDGQYDVAIQIELNFKKGNAFDAIGVKYDPEGIPVNITEESLMRSFPWSYHEVCAKCRKRYDNNFKQNKDFHDVMHHIKKNDRLYHERLLDPGNPKSPKKGFYSSNVLQELDKHYNKK